MKLMHMVSDLAVAIALAVYADKSADIQTPAPSPNTSIADTQSKIQQPNISSTVWIHQKAALPPDAVLTVTLSGTSLANAPSRVLSQRAVRTEGKQAPFSFVLPFSPADIQPNARILLSTAITVNDKLVPITDTIQTIINQGGMKADLTLVPVQQTTVPVQTSGGAATTMPSTSPTQMNPPSVVPAPAQYQGNRNPSRLERVSTPSDSAVNPSARLLRPLFLLPATPDAAVVSRGRSAKQHHDD